MKSRTGVARALVAALIGFVALPASSPADALVWTDVNSCTVLPLAPLVSGTTIAGQFSIKCTVSSSVAIEVTVGEWDAVGTVNTFMVPTDTALALTPTVIYYTPAKINTLYTVKTAYKTCWNSETDKEEFGTRIRVMTNTGTTTKGWSTYQTTTAPKINANTFTC